MAASSVRVWPSPPNSTGREFQAQRLFGEVPGLVEFAAFPVRAGEAE
jgi:hypothetical protein